jgi:hypothetical protein
MGMCKEENSVLSVAYIELRNTYFDNVVVCRHNLKKGEKKVKIGRSSIKKERMMNSFLKSSRESYIKKR